MRQQSRGPLKLRPLLLMKLWSTIWESINKYIFVIPLLKVSYTFWKKWNALQIPIILWCLPKFVGTKTKKLTSQWNNITFKCESAGMVHTGDQQDGTYPLTKLKWNRFPEPVQTNSLMVTKNNEKNKWI